MMDVGRAGRTDGSNSSGRAARNVAAGKSVGGERPGKEPSIYLNGRQPGRSMAARLVATLSQPASERITVR